MIEIVKKFLRSMYKMKISKKILAAVLAAIGFLPMVSANGTNGITCSEEKTQKVLNIDKWDLLFRVANLCGQKSVRDCIEASPKDNAYMNYLIESLRRREGFDAGRICESLSKIGSSTQKGYTYEKLKEPLSKCVIRSNGDISVADEIDKNKSLFNRDSFVVSFNSDSLCYLKDFEKITSPDGREYELSVIEYPISKKMFVRQESTGLFMQLDEKLSSKMIRLNGEFGSLFDYCPQRCINLVYSVK